MHISVKAPGLAPDWTIDGLVLIHDDEEYSLSHLTAVKEKKSLRGQELELILDGEKKRLVFDKASQEQLPAVLAELQRILQENQQNAARYLQPIHGTCVQELTRQCVDNHTLNTVQVPDAQERFEIMLKVLKEDEKILLVFAAREKRGDDPDEDVVCLLSDQRLLWTHDRRQYSGFSEKKLSEIQGASLLEDVNSSVVFINSSDPLALAVNKDFADEVAYSIDQASQKARQNA